MRIEKLHAPSGDPLKVLVACEKSGIVRDAFLALGHYAISCDLEDTRSNGPHYKGDVLDLLHEHWDLMIAHPECIYVCSSGIHRTTRGLRPQWKTDYAIDFFLTLLHADIHRIAIENPIGIINTMISPTQIIQPYQFGEDASKATCLWLKNLPKLVSTQFVPARIVNGNRRWGNQTDSGQNILPPSENRSELRSDTYRGIANAMALQWGGKIAWSRCDDPHLDFPFISNGYEYAEFYGDWYCRPIE